MPKKWFRRALIAFLVYFVVALLLITRHIHSFSSVRSYAHSDAAIVLGAAVWRDRPSPVFAERINHAVDLYHQGIVQYIIFTGGYADGDNLAESEAAREYAVERGVPAEHIFIETESYSTCLNLVEAKQIIDENGFDQVLIVSDPLHMRRAILLAEEVGIKALSSPTTTSRYQSFDNQAGFLLRELYFYVTYSLHIKKCP